MAYQSIINYQRVNTTRMEQIEARLKEHISKIFPAERYNVYMTGSALLFLKGTKYLVKNLIMSLALAIGLIALFMAYLFRSFRMIIISLIPNLFIGEYPELIGKSKTVRLSTPINSRL